MKDDRSVLLDKANSPVKSVISPVGDAERPSYTEATKGDNDDKSGQWRHE